MLVRYIMFTYYVTIADFIILGYDYNYILRHTIDKRLRSQIRNPSRLHWIKVRISQG